MKLISALVFLFALTSCKSELKMTKGVSIEILNKEIYFSKTYTSDTIRLNYQTKDDRNLGSTVLTWKLTNNTDQNLLYLVNENDLLDNTFGNSDQFFFNIYDPAGNRIVPRSYSDSYSSPTLNDKNVGNCYECSFYLDSLDNKRYTIQGIDSKDIYRLKLFSRNSFVLHTGETKTFKSLLALPIVKEQDAKTLANPFFYKALNDGDMLRLIYKIDTNKILSILQEYQLEELKANKVEIYDGEITSNSIILKGR